MHRFGSLFSFKKFVIIYLSSYNLYWLSLIYLYLCSQNCTTGIFSKNKMLQSFLMLFILGVGSQMEATSLPPIIRLRHFSLVSPGGWQKITSLHIFQSHYPYLDTLRRNTRHSGLGVIAVQGSQISCNCATEQWEVGFKGGCQAIPLHVCWHSSASPGCRWVTDVVW